MKKIISMITLFLICGLCMTGCVNDNSDRITQDQAALSTYTINGQEKPVNGYEGIEENFVLDLDNFHIYDPDELTEDILTNRTDSNLLIIERVVGIVTNRDEIGDGKILNTSELYYNYISYRNTGLPITDGTIMVSYFIYNPDNNYMDDIVDRFDFILDRRYED